MSAQLYEVCSAVWCLPTFIMFALLYDAYLPALSVQLYDVCLPVWCFPTRMIFSYLYNVSLPVWCLPTFLMSAQLYDVRLLVWCLLKLYKKPSSLLQSFPNLSHHPYPLFFIVIPNEIFHVFLLCETSEVWRNNRPFRVLSCIWREKKFYVKNRYLTSLSFACFLFREIKQNEISLDLLFRKIVRNEISLDLLFRETIRN